MCNRLLTTKMYAKDCLVCWHELSTDTCEACGAIFTHLIPNETDWEEFTAHAAELCYNTLTQ